MVNCPQIHKSSTNLPQIPHNSPHFRLSKAPQTALCTHFPATSTQKTQGKQGIFAPTPKNLRRVGVAATRRCGEGEV
jgi:hypothetical protein